MTNEPAERLRQWIVTAENTMGETMAESVLDDALAAERKAGADEERERIQAAVADVPVRWPYMGATAYIELELVLAILDAKARP